MSRTKGGQRSKITWGKKPTLSIASPYYRSPCQLNTGYLIATLSFNVLVRTTQRKQKLLSVCAHLRIQSVLRDITGHHNRPLR